MHSIRRRTTRSTSFLPSSAPKIGLMGVGRGFPIVDVVLDPIIATSLRPHQVEYVLSPLFFFWTSSLTRVSTRGVKFMYEVRRTFPHRAPPARS